MDGDQIRGALEPRKPVHRRRVGAGTLLTNLVGQRLVLVVHHQVPGWDNRECDRVALVLRVFRIRTASESQRSISESTGVYYSTVRQMLHNRAYLGEVKYNDDWFPGLHGALVSADAWAAAHRG